MADEEEVLLEVEAVQAVYGDDCEIIDEFPPHLTLQIKPRTADDSSQQFVEATIGIKTSAQYPKESPHVYIVEEKGLDEKRQTHLITSIQNKASELSSCLMLVALCEEAVEILSNMNHPEGDCPLCLYSLVTEDISGTSLPFMKLMSCYHCFHRDCIMRWWKWLHEQNETNEMNLTEETSAGSTGSHKGMHTGVNQHKGNCPVCRKVFDVKDIEHVLDYLGADLSHSSSTGVGTDDDVKAFLQLDSENSRRLKFEAVLKLQKENSGLIEPRKDLVILPGMFLPEASTSATVSVETSSDQRDDIASMSTKELGPNGSLNKRPTRKQNNSGGMRRNIRSQVARKQPHAQVNRKQWIKKENVPEQ